jgi:hypothetical protein
VRVRVRVHVRVRVCVWVGGWVLPGVPHARVLHNQNTKTHSWGGFAEILGQYGGTLWGCMRGAQALAPYHFCRVI